MNKQKLIYYYFDKNRLNQHITSYNQIIRGKCSKPVPRSSPDTWIKITHEHVNSV